MTTNRIKGRDAIEHAEANGLTLNKYADPTEGAREGLSVDEAREIAKEDPALIWIEVSGSKLNTANEILSDAGTKLVQSHRDASWTTKRALPLWQCNDLERRLNAAGIETSTAIDNDDRSVGWLYCTVD